MKKAPGTARQRGAALVIVLWTALLVSMALAVAMASARIEARIEAARMEEFRGRLAAGDGLAYAAYRIATDNRPATEVLAELKFASNGYDVSFAPSPEAEKLDLNLASEETLARFFEFLGAAPALAVTLAARVADWRDTDDLSRPNGAERRDYATARNGERIGNRPFYAIDEIALVLGMPEDITQCAMPALTVFGNGGPPSIGLLTKLYGRDMDRNEASAPVRLGTASRSAAAGNRHALSATAALHERARRQPVTLTGVFRVTGARARPFEWIARFDESDQSIADAFCGQGRSARRE